MSDSHIISKTHETYTALLNLMLGKCETFAVKENFTEGEEKNFKKASDAHYSGHIFMRSKDIELKAKKKLEPYFIKKVHKDGKYSFDDGDFTYYAYNREMLSILSEYENFEALSYAVGSELIFYSGENMILHVYDYENLTVNSSFFGDACKTEQ